METFPDLVETFKEYSVSDFYNMIFHSYYFPTLYIFHCVYICYYLRTSVKNHIKWYHSFILGFVMTLGPRLVIADLCARPLPEWKDFSAFQTYTIIWLLYNMFPFDIIFKISDRISTKIIIHFLNAYSDIQSLTNLCISALMIFEGNVLRVSLIIIAGMIVPYTADIIDRYLFGQRRFPTVYSWNMIKRWILFSLFTSFFGFYGFTQKSISMSSSNIVLFLAQIFYLFLIVFDLIICDGHVFFSVDVLLPNFWKNIAQYYPLEPYQSPKSNNKKSVQKVKAE